MSIIIGPTARVLAAFVSVVLLPALVHSQDPQNLSRYRGAEIGSTLMSVATLWGLAPTDAKVVHKRPALMNDLDWRPKLAGGGGPDQQDPVREVQFSFYDDQLFRIVVSYQRDRILGLTDTDLVEALSAVYGSPATSAVGKPRASETSDYIFDDTVIARWENADSSVALLRASHSTPVRLVVLSKRLAGLARTAAAAAARLDEQEEPQRVADRQKQEADASRISAEKARSANKAAFKP
jgi:hypothetical protein